MIWKDKPLFYKIFLIISALLVIFGLAIIIFESFICSRSFCEWGFFMSLFFGLPLIGIGFLFLILANFLLFIRNSHRLFGNLILIPLLILFSWFFIVSTLGKLEIYPYAAWRLFGTNYIILIEYWAQIIIEGFLIILVILANIKNKIYSK